MKIIIINSLKYIQMNSKEHPAAIEANTLLCAVNRNYVSPGDWIETNDGTFAKIEKLEFREVYTDKGVIKKNDIKQVYVLNGV